MPIITNLNETNIWKSVCKEVEDKKRQYELNDENDSQLLNKKEQLIQYDASKHSSVFYNCVYIKCNIDDPKLINDYNPSIVHPACYGYSIEKYEKTLELNENKKSLKDANKCSEREYILEYIFPVLLPALEEMLKEAKKNKCFERKRTAFNALDYLTKYLYTNNLFISESERLKRRGTSLWEIPFVRDHNEKYPRKELPKSLQWTEEEAACRIQAFYRGYLIRRDPNVQELRQWQREWREDNQRIQDRVDSFWANK